LKLSITNDQWSIVNDESNNEPMSDSALSIGNFQFTIGNFQFTILN